MKYKKNLKKLHFFAFLHFFQTKPLFFQWFGRVKNLFQNFTLLVSKLHPDRLEVCMDKKKLAVVLELLAVARQIQEELPNHRIVFVPAERGLDESDEDY